MLVRVGSEFVYAAPDRAHALVQVEPRRDGAFEVLEERWDLTPEVGTRTYVDGFGNSLPAPDHPAGPVRAAL